jgi:hypothetical protein
MARWKADRILRASNQRWTAGPADQGDHGELLTMFDTHGNTLAFTAGAIASNRGRQVQIDRDLPDASPASPTPRQLPQLPVRRGGKLIAVTDRVGNSMADPADRKTTFTYRTDKPHYLDAVFDPLAAAA